MKKLLIKIYSKLADYYSRKNQIEKLDIIEERIWMLSCSI